MNTLYHVCIGAFLSSVVFLAVSLFMGWEIGILGVWGILTGVGLLVGKRFR